MLDYNARKVSKRPDLGTCTCGCTWFEQFKVMQYSTNHSSIIGQHVPAISEEYIVLRCVKCNELFQPNVVTALQDKRTKAYDDFKNEIDAPIQQIAQEKDPLKELSVETIKE